MQIFTVWTTDSPGHGGKTGSSNGHSTKWRLKEQRLIYKSNQVYHIDHHTNSIHLFPAKVLCPRVSTKRWMTRMTTLLLWQHVTLLPHWKYLLKNNSRNILVNWRPMKINRQQIIVYRCIEQLIEREVNKILYMSGFDNGRSRFWTRWKKTSKMAMYIL